MRFYEIGSGVIRLDGVDWNARCVTPGDILNPGDHCRVTEIHSTLLLVEPILTESRKADHPINKGDALWFCFL